MNTETKRVGRVYGFLKGGNIEWRRLVSLKPEKYGALLKITAVGEVPPAKVFEVADSIVCLLCDGTGCFPTFDSECSRCKGTGRKKHVFASRFLPSGIGAKILLKLWKFPLDD